MALGSAALDFDNNVQIRILDRKGKVIRTSYVHNKATANLVNGILRFLEGDFNNTKFNLGGSSPEEASIYIPVKAGVGRIGVKIVENENPSKRRFNYINKGEFITPTFDSSSLQEPITTYDSALLKFNRISQTGYTDNNNSRCLEMSLYVNPGKLVGYNLETDHGIEFVPYDWAYFNPSTGEYEVMITEVGLMSESDVLLARILFDGEVDAEEFFDQSGKSQGTYPVFRVPSNPTNPIIQSESTTMVLVWRIGVVSVGANDEFITSSSITTKQFSQGLADWVVNYITEVTGLSPNEWVLGHTVQTVQDDTIDKVLELLEGSSVADLK